MIRHGSSRIHSRDNPYARKYRHQMPSPGPSRYLPSRFDPSRNDKSEERGRILDRHRNWHSTTNPKPQTTAEMRPTTQRLALSGDNANTSPVAPAISRVELRYDETHPSHSVNPSANSQETIHKISSGTQMYEHAVEHAHPDCKADNPGNLGLHVESAQNLGVESETTEQSLRRPGALLDAGTDAGFLANTVEAQVHHAPQLQITAQTRSRWGNVSDLHTSSSQTEQDDVNNKITALLSSYSTQPLSPYTGSNSGLTNFNESGLQNQPMFSEQTAPQPLSSSSPTRPRLRDRRKKK